MTAVMEKQRELSFKSNYQIIAHVITGNHIAIIIVVSIVALIVSGISGLLCPEWLLRYHDYNDVISFSDIDAATRILKWNATLVDLTKKNQFLWMELNVRRPLELHNSVCVPSKLTETVTWDQSYTVNIAGITDEGVRENLTPQPREDVASITCYARDPNCTPFTFVSLFSIHYPSYEIQLALDTSFSVFPKTICEGSYMPVVTTIGSARFTDYEIGWKVFMSLASLIFFIINSVILVKGDPQNDSFDLQHLGDRHSKERIVLYALSFTLILYNDPFFFVHLNFPNAYVSVWSVFCTSGTISLLLMYIILRLKALNSQIKEQRSTVKFHPLESTDTTSYHDGAEGIRDIHSNMNYSDNENGASGRQEVRQKAELSRDDSRQAMTSSSATNPSTRRSKIPFVPQANPHDPRGTNRGSPSGLEAAQPFSSLYLNVLYFAVGIFFLSACISYTLLRFEQEANPAYNIWGGLYSSHMALFIFGYILFACFLLYITYQTYYILRHIKILRATDILSFVITVTMIIYYSTFVFVNAFGVYSSLSALMLQSYMVPTLYTWLFSALWWNYPLHAKTISKQRSAHPLPNGERQEGSEEDDLFNALELMEVNSDDFSDLSVDSFTVPFPTIVTPDEMEERIPLPGIMSPDFPDSSLDGGFVGEVSSDTDATLRGNLRQAKSE